MSNDVTILCSAVGTDLTTISNKLGQESDVLAVDLEEELKTVYIKALDAPGHAQPLDRRHASMSRICGTNDRDTVLGWWHTAAEKSLKKLKESTFTANILACHLTYFSPTRLEFYAPAISRLFPEPNADITVKRVVVLIDDIYDMRHRLPDSLFDSDFYIEHVRKLTALSAKNIDLSSEEVEALQVEERIKSLIRLLHWRRSEMIAAEELARHIDVPLTVMATKHSRQALLQLVRSPDSPTVYISHKITEVRAENLASDAQTPTQRWNPFTSEVNSLTPSLLNVGVIGIQPTGIDELRFQRNQHTETRMGAYTGILSDRWPVPPDSLYTPSSSSAPEHRAIVTDGNHPGIANLLSLFQQSVYEEIAYRDHLLVSCNDGLLVYRPTAFGTRISSGVEAEAQHWALSCRSLNAVNRRPACFVHIEEDLIRFTKGISGEVWRRNLLVAVRGELTSLLPMDRIEQLWQDFQERGGLPTEWPKDFSDHLYRGAVHGSPTELLGEAISNALVSAVTQVHKIPADAVAWTIHFVARDSDESHSAQLLGKIASLMATRDYRIASEANRSMISTVRHAFQVTTDPELAIELMKLD